MSRELLRRTLEYMDQYEWANRKDSVQLYEDIETYLAQPDEPFGYVSPSSARVMAHDGAWDSLQIYSERFSDADIAMYLSPPDQSARVAELAADGVRLMETITELRNQLVTPNWENNRIAMQVGELKELKQQLAALQAKREQLAWDELKRLSDECGIEWSSDAINFARAIEAAHGIGG